MRLTATLEIPGEVLIIARADDAVLGRICLHNRDLYIDGQRRGEAVVDRVETTRVYTDASDIIPADIIIDRTVLNAILEL